MILLTVLLSGCAITIKPLPTYSPRHLKQHHYGKGKNKVAAKPQPKPAQTPTPKMSDVPPFPPPNYDEIIRRTHPTPTISPFDFQ